MNDLAIALWTFAAALLAYAAGAAFAKWQRRWADRRRRGGVDRGAG
jgi:hypothetical protein